LSSSFTIHKVHETLRHSRLITVTLWGSSLRILLLAESNYKIINVKHHRRMKRSAADVVEAVDSTINIKISDSNNGECEACFVPLTNCRRLPDENFLLKLFRSQSLIDSSFVFISRNQNQSQFVDESFDVARKYSDCFYRNENSAFDLCDHEIVSN